MKTKTIKVIQKDIDSGTSHPLSCPIALAAQRAFRRKNISVGTRAMNLRDARYKIRQSIGLPESAKDFIAKFDHNIPVEPFSFNITYYDEK